MERLNLLIPGEPIRGANVGFLHPVHLIERDVVVFCGHGGVSDCKIDGKPNTTNAWDSCC